MLATAIFLNYLQIIIIVTTNQFPILVHTPCINEGEISLLDPDYEGYLNIFTGDQVNVTGRVGVCRNGSYDSVCDVNWDANDAVVLCRTIIPRKIIATIETTLYLQLS